MNMRSSIRALGLLLGFLGMVVDLGSLSASTDGQAKVAGLYYVLNVEDGSGQRHAEAVNVQEFSAVQATQRVFSESPAGGRFVLERILRPGEGVTLYRFVAEEVGLRVVLERRTDVRVEMTGPLDYGDSLRNLESWLGKEIAVEWILRVDGNQLLVSQGQQEDLELPSAFLEQLARQGAAARIGSRLTGSLQEEVAFLGSVLASRSGSGSAFADFRQLVAILRSALAAIDHGATERYRDATWTIETHGAHHGTRIGDEAVAGFLEGFAEFDRSTLDPLAGLHAEPSLNGGSN